MPADLSGVQQRGSESIVWAQEDAVVEHCPRTVELVIGHGLDEFAHRLSHHTTIPKRIIPHKAKVQGRGIEPGRDQQEEPEDIQETSREEFEKRFDSAYVCQQVEKTESLFTRRASFPDDTFPQVSAPSGLAVTGWVFGSEVEIAAGIPWVSPILNRIEGWHELDLPTLPTVRWPATP